MSPWYLYLQEITSLSPSVVLLFFFFLHYSLKKAFLSLLALLWNFAFRQVYLSFSALPFASLISSAICKASSYNPFTFFHFFFLRMVLITTSCTMLENCFHRSSGALSDIIPWSYLSLPLYNGIVTSYYKWLSSQTLQWKPVLPVPLILHSLALTHLIWPKARERRQILALPSPCLC